MDHVLHDLFIRTDIDDSKAMVSFTAPEGCTHVKWEIADGDLVVAQGECDATPGQAVAFDAVIPDAKLWNVDTPHLYTLKLTLGEKGDMLLFRSGDDVSTSQRPAEKVACPQWR
jgi:beta-galactosidase/beta-glucuronidase